MSGYDVDGNRNHDDSFFTFHNPSSDNRSYWNKRILVMAIASLTIVIIVVLALHIYARFVLRRQARRRFAIHQLSLTIQAQAHHHHHEHHNTRGLDPNIIATLPILKKKQQQDHGGECAVCLSAVEDEQEIRLLPNCKHSFHVGCIDTWLASNSTCPICRTKAEPQLEPHTRENPILVLDDASILQLEDTSNSDGNNNGAIVESSSKNVSGSSSVSRFSSSFRRILLSRDRSSSRIQPSIITHLDDHDLESQ
ncbi:hypothetical protein PIB30_025924 [Stylosanthes scabra]|uniref:RING-type E3 ubiquitin transferase n=1 Tax=Stylosanthes scabra TaxID=79078 RepID=A0ABU6Q9R5_9FABA|nr:hypothetical protein [Stylosanthes scabra]